MTSAAITGPSSSGTLGVPPFGLLNSGAICYINSLTQSLISCAPVVEAIKKCDPKKSEAVKIFQELIKSDKQGRPLGVKNVAGMVALLAARHKHFGMGQEDASEGFDLLLDIMGPTFEQAFTSHWLVNIYCDGCRTLVSSPTTDIMNRIIMERHYEPLLADKGVDEYVSGHVTQVSHYRCPKCKKDKVPAMKVSRMIKPPQVLIISFNKFMNKWHDEEHRTTMTIRYGKHQEHKKCYRLAAVVEHHGGRRGGHYVARARRPGGTYLFNDSRVAPSTLLPGRPNDYILFYV